MQLFSSHNSLSVWLWQREPASSEQSVLNTAATNDAVKVRKWRHNANSVTRRLVVDTVACAHGTTRHMKSTVETTLSTPVEAAVEMLVEVTRNWRVDSKRGAYKNGVGRITYKA